MAQNVVFFESTDPKGITARCEWASSGIYTVTVTYKEHKKTKTFGQTFTPTFGMDVADAQQAEQIAEAFAVEFETEFKI